MTTYLILLMSVVSWGMYPIFAHYYVLSIDPLFLAATSLIISAAPFIIVVAFKKNDRKKIFSRSLLKTLFPIALFAAIGHLLLFGGTKLTSGANTGLLLQIEPVYALFLGALFFGEVIGKARIGATLLMIAGAMVIVYKGGVSPNIGDLFVLLSTLMFQFSHTIVKKLFDKGVGIALISAIRQVFMGLILVALAVSINYQSFVGLLTLKNLGSATFLGLYLALDVFFWYAAIKRLPVSVVSSFIPLTAFVSLLGSIFFLKETISTQQYMGFFLIVGGLVWFAKIYARR